MLRLRRLRSLRSLLCLCQCDFLCYFRSLSHRTADPLDNLEENGGPVANRLGENLEKDPLLVAIGEQALRVLCGVM
jgi:hypothetical protein